MEVFLVYYRPFIDKLDQVDICYKFNSQLSLCFISEFVVRVYLTE